MDDFRPIKLRDKPVFDKFFSEDPPEGSEFTFTNLFMWRDLRRPTWRVWENCLLIVFCPDEDTHYGLQPMGLGDKSDALEFLTRHLEKLSPDVRIARVTSDFVRKYVPPDRYRILEDRNNSDYVYLADNLIRLPGNKYHKKKNHVNKFMKSNVFEYRQLDADLTAQCLDLQEEWCELRECVLNPGLFSENMAIHEALTHYTELGFAGGAILIESKVEGFALGEKLSPDTAVIHVEKANPKIPGLYAAINQQFCAAAWSHVRYINREQDLGEEGLRQAKLSYYPDHMVDKFTLVPKT